MELYVRIGEQVLSNKGVKQQRRRERSGGCDVQNRKVGSERGMSHEKDGEELEYSICINYMKQERNVSP